MTPATFRDAAADSALAPLMSVSPGLGGTALEGAAAFVAELRAHGVVSRDQTAAAIDALAAAAAIEANCVLLVHNDDHEKKAEEKKKNKKKTPPRRRRR